MYIPLITGEVIVNASLHILESVQCGKHVDELGESEQVCLRDEVLPLLRVGQSTHLFTEPRGRIPDKPQHLLGLVDLWTQNGDCLLVDLHTICLLVSFNLCVCVCACVRVCVRVCVYGVSGTVVTLSALHTTFSGKIWQNLHMYMYQHKYRSTSIIGFSQECAHPPLYTQHYPMQGLKIVLYMSNTSRRMQCIVGEWERHVHKCV